MFEFELQTGWHNNFYMNNKVYGSEDLCRFCEEEEETFDHIITDYPCFYLDRCDLLQNQPICCELSSYISYTPLAASYSYASTRIWRNARQHLLHGTFTLLVLSHVCSHVRFSTIYILTIPWNTYTVLYLTYSCPHTHYTSVQDPYWTFRQTAADTVYVSIEQGQRRESTHSNHTLGHRHI